MTGIVGDGVVENNALMIGDVTVGDEPTKKSPLHIQTAEVSKENTNEAYQFHLPLS